MLVTTDIRLVELKVLENLTNGIWADGVCTAAAAGQTKALGLSQRTYADLLVTLFEDGLLYTNAEGLRKQLDTYEREKRNAFRDQTVIWLAVSSVFHLVTVTYRGLRRIDELRDQLRSDRVLERFGILLDGRYIISDLIYFLERAKGEPISLLFGDVDDFKQFNSNHGYKAGDAVLRHVFGIARHSVGNRGDVYRRGGEEIIVLLPYCDLNTGKELAEHIREEVEKTSVSYDSETLNATLSIGVASSPHVIQMGQPLKPMPNMHLRGRRGKGRTEWWQMDEGWLNMNYWRP